jgi:GH25 family lysozyme M1 (1,4-beta-N-acetylmuramidase)
MIKYGIDVSEHQGNIAWNETAKHIDYAIIRAGLGRYSTQVDKYFQSNYDRAKAAGVPIGAYWYSYAMSADEARLEAAACLEVIKGKQFEYPIYFDVEEQKIFDLGRDKVSKIIEAFCHELEKDGYFAGLYMSAYPLTKYTTEHVKRRYAVWVANYDVSKPDYSGPYGIWQKSSSGTVDGIAGNVDVDVCYTDYPTVIKNLGDNGFPKHTAPAPTKKTMKVTVEYDDHTYSGLLEEQ